MKNKIVTPIKVKVNFEGETTKVLLKFITETKEGKYTDQKPDLAQITYKQLQIQEQDKITLVGEENGNVLLYGLSY